MEIQGERKSLHDDRVRRVKNFMLMSSGKNEWRVWGWKVRIIMGEWAEEGFFFHCCRPFVGGDTKDTLILLNSFILIVGETENSLNSGTAENSMRASEGKK